MNVVVADPLDHTTALQLADDDVVGPGGADDHTLLVELVDELAQPFDRRCVDGSDALEVDHDPPLVSRVAVHLLTATRTPVRTSRIITPRVVTAANSASDRLKRTKAVNPAMSMMAIAAATITAASAGWGISPVTCRAAPP